MISDTTKKWFRRLEEIEMINFENEEEEETIKEGYYRVSEILSPLSRFEEIPEDKLKNAATRGDTVHRWIKKFILTQQEYFSFTIDHLPESYQPWGQSFLRWWDVKSIQCLETRFYDDKLRITGQCDMIYFDGYRHILCDFKTTYTKSKSWPIQLSAYAYLARENGYTVDEIQIVHLSRDGSPPKIYKYDEDFEMFKKSLDVYEYYFLNRKEKGPHM
jgi:hypothetical protein